jgi:hypothetical protein
LLWSAATSRTYPTARPRRIPCGRRRPQWRDGKYGANVATCERRQQYARLDDGAKHGRLWGNGGRDVAVIGAQK